MPNIKQINDNGVVYEIMDEVARNGLLNKANSSDVYDKNTIDSKLSAKANTNDTYTKTQTNEQINTTVNAKIAELVGTAPDNLNTIQELAQAIEDNKDFIDAINSSITTKADKATTYTKTEVNDLVNAKANIADVYNKTDIDGKLDLKANITDLSNYLLKTDASSTYATKNELSNYITTDVANSTFATKTDIGNINTILDSINGEVI